MVTNVRTTDDWNIHRNPKYTKWIIHENELANNGKNIWLMSYSLCNHIKSKSTADYVSKTFTIFCNGMTAI